MAHHNSTPRSILDAPASVPEVISEQRGYSRRERRHGVFVPPGTNQLAAEAAHAEAVRAGKNVPFTRAEAERQRQARLSLATKLIRGMRRDAS